MDLNVLRTFVAVCEYSGFSAAGERLGYTQSTVSSQIRQLEKELNVALFDRFYHRIVLTQEGSLVLRYARDVLTAQEKLMVALHQADGPVHPRDRPCVQHTENQTRQEMPAHWSGLRGTAAGVPAIPESGEIPDRFSVGA